MNRYLLKNNPIFPSTTDEQTLISRGVHYYLTFYYFNDSNQHCSKGIDLTYALLLKKLSDNIIKIDNDNNLLNDFILYAKTKNDRDSIINSLEVSPVSIGQLADSGWFYFDFFHTSSTTEWRIYSIETGVFRGKANLNTVEQQILMKQIANPIAMIKIPDDIVNIYSYSFASEEFVDLKLPNTITNIDSHGFEECKSLTHLTIPKSQVRIRILGDAFNKCINLNLIDFYPTDCWVSQSAFNNCTGLSNNSTESPIRGIVNLYCTPPQAKSMLQSANYIKNSRGNFVKKIIVNCNTRPSKVVAKNGGSTEATVTTEFTPDTGGVVWALS